MVRLTVPRAALAIVCAAGTAHANLIQNGGFESSTLTGSDQFTTEVTGWTNAMTGGYTGYGYNFLVAPGQADSPNGFISRGGNYDALWGPQTPGVNRFSDNGLPATSPSGGNYIVALAGSLYRGAISQTVTGLTIGTAYELTFEWGAAQFANYFGDTTEAWQVGFGGESSMAPTVVNPSQGFTAWRTTSMTFVASSTSQVLSFLAEGTPTGLPPTLLLDNVNLNAVPEPGSMALLGAGLAGVGFVSWRRRKGA